MTTPQQNKGSQSQKSKQKNPSSAPQHQPKSSQAQQKISNTKVQQQQHPKQEAPLQKKSPQDQQKVQSSKKTTAKTLESTGQLKGGDQQKKQQSTDSSAQDQSNKQQQKHQQQSTGQQQQEKKKPPLIIYRSRQGLEIIEGLPPCNQVKQLSTQEQTIGNSVFCSEDGKLVAWCDSKRIKCYNFETETLLFDKENEQKINNVYISPKSTRLVCYSNMANGDNLHFWDISTQTLLASMPFKKASHWKPVFSMNDEICILHVGNDLLIYTQGDFEKPKQRISHIKVTDFDLSTTSTHDSKYQHLYEKRCKNKTHHVAVYVAGGSKGTPSIVKIFKYPNFTSCITNKSFFKADRVKFLWSPSGNSLLLLCQSEFDQSGKSYYGEQTLQFMSVKHDSCFVKLSKEGPISHYEWLPDCSKDVFICVYGFMPSKVSLFDHKCNIIHDFEPGSFNTASFNPFGNLLAIYGFGNLAGQLSIWSIGKKKQIFTVKIPETVNLEWSPDGIHFLTSTITPRLRVNNGFRLWHSSGNLIYEHAATDTSKNLELYDVFWQPRPDSVASPPSETKPSKFKNLLPQSTLNKYQKAAAKYVPPSMRSSTSLPKQPPPSSSFKQSDPQVRQN